MLLMVRKALAGVFTFDEVIVTRFNYCLAIANVSSLETFRMVECEPSGTDSVLCLRDAVALYFFTSMDFTGEENVSVYAS